ncbi:hypothetical protein VFPPC_15296 [Pochonia chlamydosporia 170]|uniref:Uncharacterized protein n=1 Tax=Pochonia chlamydosporia 170 TaxID=1380566 RepID=A0A179G760_METCM|nr:hypothetical protein VFPPC_15296 [Pochonia chlamydosporia 170]OAQ73378.1 hypothetical protein VFPPC_15296 [Pochonia chlamydosporia 170]
MYQIPPKRDCSVVYPQKVVWVSTRTRDFKRNEQRLKYQGHVSQAFQTYGRQPRKRGTINHQRRRCARIGGAAFGALKCSMPPCLHVSMSPCPSADHVVDYCRN